MNMSSSKSNQLICLKHAICSHISANGCSCYPSWQYNYFTVLIMNYRSDVIAHASSEHLCSNILSHCSAVFLTKGKKIGHTNIYYIALKHQVPALPADYHSTELGLSSLFFQIGWWLCWLLYVLRNTNLCKACPYTSFIKEAILTQTSAATADRVRPFPIVLWAWKQTSPLPGNNMLLMFLYFLVQLNSRRLQIHHKFTPIVFFLNNPNIWA